ncbi:MAG: nucleoside hydrolase [Clostridia bacterium]|nr:nucleoside hydrolase [Clostridia bacterium]
MEWPKLSFEAQIARLNPPAGRPVDMVLDTDTYNEVDDQFALCLSLLSPDRVTLRAVYAAPFHNERSTGPEDGMVKSYGEILRLLGKVNVKAEGFVFEGSRSYLPDGKTPVDSPAARDLVARAMARPEGDPLYVVAIGCITNVASALLMEPRLAEKIVVVWLAGHELAWPNTREFNMMQDKPASQVVLDCGVPLVLVPCMGVASHMTASTYELEACIGGKNALCDALCALFAAFTDNHYGWAKEIWDVAAVAALAHPEWAPTELVHSPILSSDDRYSFDNRRHFIRVVRSLNRTAIFRDMFTRLSKAEEILKKQ